MALIEAMHAQGVVHRDICGHHLLLMPNGSLRLIDFGHASWLAGCSLDASPEAMALDIEALHCLLAWLAEAQLSRQVHLLKADAPGHSSQVGRHI